MDRSSQGREKVLLATVAIQTFWSSAGYRSTHKMWTGAFWGTAISFHITGVLKPRHLFLQGTGKNYALRWHNCFSHTNILVAAFRSHSVCKGPLQTEEDHCRVRPEDELGPSWKHLTKVQGIHTRGGNLRIVLCPMFFDASGIVHKLIVKCDCRMHRNAELTDSPKRKWLIKDAVGLCFISVPGCISTEVVSQEMKLHPSVCSPILQ